MKDLHIKVLFAILEDPDPKENFVVFNSVDLKYACVPDETTLKDFYSDIIKILIPGCDEYKSYMFKVFESNYKESKCFADCDSQKAICDLFDIDNTINLLYYPDYEGAGCWGESNGLRFDIRSEENNHMSEPHIHVSRNHDEDNRIDIINLCIIDDKNKKSKDLKGKHKKHALELVKKHQTDFLKIWNDYTGCEKVLDIDYYIKHNEVKLRNRKSNEFFTKRNENISKNRWYIVNGKIDIV